MDEVHQIRSSQCQECDRHPIVDIPHRYVMQMMRCPMIRTRVLIALTVSALIAMTAGCGADQSETTPNAVPTVTQESGEPEAEAEVKTQPFDGGSYTWKSGIRMDTKVEKVEPWGGTSDDFCGDGSCGIADPDDTRFVLRYTVTVPDDFEGKFDPYSCPGEFEPMNGNSDEAGSGVAGDYSRSLGDVILPGTTKFGVTEQYIEKAYAKETFYILSTCGDPEGMETAHFEGKIKQP